MTNQNCIIGVGRAFTDIIANVDDAYLAKFNIPKGIGVRIEQEQLAPMIAALTDPIYMAGGSVANTIAGIHALGAKAAFIGKTGDDAAGKAFRDEFDRTGVRFENAPVVGGTSGTCLCLNTPDGDRSFAFTVGVCEDLTPTDMPLTMFDEASMMVLQVMMMETHVCFESMREFLPTLPKHVKKVMCLHDLADKGKVTDLALTHVDIVLGSQTEFKYIIGIESEEELKSYAAAHNILMAMTCGEAGAILAAPDETVHIPAIPPAKIVDTVGAGDFFAAGFLYGIAEGWDLKAAGTLGANCASLIIEEVGGRPSEACAERMRALLS